MVPNSDWVLDHFDLPPEALEEQLVAAAGGDAPAREFVFMAALRWFRNFFFARGFDVASSERLACHAADRFADALPFIAHPHQWHPRAYLTVVAGSVLRAAERRHHATDAVDAVDVVDKHGTRSQAPSRAEWRPTLVADTRSGTDVAESANHPCESSRVDNRGAKARRVSGGTHIHEE